VLLYSIVEGLLRPLLMTVWRVELHDASRIPERGAVVVASNHDSLLDGFFLALATRRQLRFMAKAELFRYPLLRQVMHGIGAFPVLRNADEGRAIARGVELLERGEAIAIFPQGTALPYRNRPYRRGAARLALAAGAPIVPVALINTEKALRPHRVRVGFPRVLVIVGKPIEVARQEPAPAAVSTLTVRLEQAIEGLRAPFGPPEHVWIELR
jgi:1-acyl-sn-glycerol-3-phosphate acyltransferase